MDQLLIAQPPPVSSSHPFTPQMASSSSSVKNTFVQQMQNMMGWIDSDALHLTKDEILDGIRVRLLVMVRKFIAFPHCHNFSLMQQPISDK